MRSYLLLSILLVLTIPAGAAPSADGYIRDWLALSPIPFFREPTGRSALHFPQLPNEARVQPVAGQYIKILDRELFWIEIPSKDPAINLEALAGAPQSGEAIAWLAIYLVSDVDKQEIELRTGSSDMAKVFLNGKAVFAKEISRNHKLESDITSVTLRKGVNPLIFKVVNAGGEWKASLRITAPGGKTLETPLRTAVNPRLDLADFVPLDDQGFVRTWLLLSPVNYAPLLTGWGLLDKMQIASESKLQPRAGEKVKLAIGDQATPAGTELVWKSFPSSDIWLDLAAASEVKKNHNLLGYAVAYVHSPENRKVVKLKTGSSDQLRLYLNGKRVVNFDAYRAFRPDQDVTTVSLRKGLNVIVAKVLNGEGRWGVSARFTGLDDQPITDLQVTTNPP